MTTFKGEIKTPAEDWLGPEYREYAAAKHRMATTAIHLLGDISRDEPALCIVGGEDGEDYIGCFAFGFGFIHVRFPKATTRKLTPAEAAHYEAGRPAMGSLLLPPIEIDPDDIEDGGAK